MYEKETHFGRLALCRGLEEVGLGVAHCGGPLRVCGEEAGEAGVHCRVCGVVVMYGLEMYSYREQGPGVFMPSSGAAESHTVMGCPLKALEARLRAHTNGTPARLSYADHHGLRIPLYCWFWPSPYKSLSRRLA